MPEVSRKIDVIAVDSRQIVSRIILHLKFMDTQSERIHENTLQQNNGLISHLYHGLRIIKVLKQ